MAFSLIKYGACEIASKSVAECLTDKRYIMWMHNSGCRTTIGESDINIHISDYNLINTR